MRALVLGDFIRRDFVLGDFVRQVTNKNLIYTSEFYDKTPLSQRGSFSGVLLIGKQKKIVNSLDPMDRSTGTHLFIKRTHLFTLLSTLFFINIYIIFVSRVVFNNHNLETNRNKFHIFVKKISKHAQ